MGKYVSARSAGNFLAGWNASNAVVPHYDKIITGLDKELFMKLAGTLHYSSNVANDSDPEKIARLAGTLLFDNIYGKAPYYGEIPYAGRMINKGWNFGKGK